MRRFYVIARLIFGAVGVIIASVPAGLWLIKDFDSLSDAAPFRVLNDAGHYRDLFFVCLPACGIALVSCADYFMLNLGKNSRMPFRSTTMVIAGVLCFLFILGGMVGFIVFEHGKPAEDWLFNFANKFLALAILVSFLTEFFVANLLARQHWPPAKVEPAAQPH